MWPLLSRNWFSLLIFRVTLSGRQRDRRSAWRSGLALRVVLRCYHSRASGQPNSECCTFSVFMFHLLEKQPLSRIHFPSEGSSAWFLLHRISLRTSLTLAELWKTNHKCFFFLLLFCHLPLFLFSSSFHIEFYSLILFFISPWCQDLLFTLGRLSLWAALALQVPLVSFFLYFSFLLNIFSLLCSLLL